MITHVTHSGDEHAEPNDARHPIERPEMVADDREDVEGGEPRRSAARFRVELRTDASDEFRLMAFGRKDAAQEEQIARPHCLDIHAEGCRWFWKLDVGCPQPLFRAHRREIVSRVDCCHVGHLPPILD